MVSRIVRHSGQVYEIGIGPMLRHGFVLDMYDDIEKPIGKITAKRTGFHK